jgi:hypothetical protein
MQLFYAVGKFIATFRRLRLPEERLLNCYLLSFSLYALESVNGVQSFDIGQLCMKKSFI